MLERIIIIFFLQRANNLFLFFTRQIDLEICKADGLIIDCFIRFI